MTSQCASGSGQFLENIARYLGVSHDEIGQLSMQATKPEKVSSICAVLAETDVINMVSRGITTSGHPARRAREHGGAVRAAPAVARVRGRRVRERRPRVRRRTAHGAARRAREEGAGTRQARRRDARIGDLRRRRSARRCGAATATGSCRKQDVAWTAGSEGRVMRAARSRLLSAVMGMPDLTYLRPDSLSDACALARRLRRRRGVPRGRHRVDSRTSIAIARPARQLIASSHLEELRGITTERGALRIGALTTIAEIAASAARARPPGGTRRRGARDRQRADPEPRDDRRELLPRRGVRGHAARGDRGRRTGPCGRRPWHARRCRRWSSSSVARHTVLAAGRGAGGDRAAAATGRRPGRATSASRAGKGASLAVAAVAVRVTLVGATGSPARASRSAPCRRCRCWSPRAAAMLEGERPSAALFARAAAVCADEALPITDRARLGRLPARTGERARRSRARRSRGARGGATGHERRSCWFGSTSTARSARSP